MAQPASISAETRYQPRTQKLFSTIHDHPIKYGRTSVHIAEKSCAQGARREKQSFQKKKPMAKNACPVKNERASDPKRKHQCETLLCTFGAFVQSRFIRGRSCAGRLKAGKSRRPPESEEKQNRERAEPETATEQEFSLGASFGTPRFGSPC